MKYILITLLFALGACTTTAKKQDCKDKDKCKIEQAKKKCTKKDCKDKDKCEIKKAKKKSCH